MKGPKTSLLVTSFALAALSFGCEVNAAGEGGPVYQVSTSATEEILLLRSYGGMGFHAPRYRLYGDGRLVREIVHKGTKEVQGSDEVQLSLEDMDLLMQLCVESRLPELTPERLRQAMGRRPLEMEDGATIVLHLRFVSYQRPGEEEQAPFSPRVEMHSPLLQLEFFPELREVQGFVALRETLDGYFPRSANEVLYGRKSVKNE